MRMFKAHNDQVTSLAMSPSDDNFLSTSADGVLCLWNLSNPSCLAAMRLASSDYDRPIAAYDPSGLVQSASLCMLLEAYKERNDMQQCSFIVVMYHIRYSE